MSCELILKVRSQIQKLRKLKKVSKILINCYSFSISDENLFLPIAEIFSSPRKNRKMRKQTKALTRVIKIKYLSSIRNKNHREKLSMICIG